MRWLDHLRATLYGLLVLMLAGMALVGGIFTARNLERPPVTVPVKEVPAERKKAARDAVEAALAARFAGRHGVALGHLEEAGRQDPALRGLDYQLALTQLYLRDFAAAQAAARRSVEKNEEKSNAQALTGLIALEKARGGGAVESVREEVLAAVAVARETDPLAPMPFYVLAEFYRAAGQPDLAIEAYRGALQRVSKTDSIMVTAVKAGLAGLRLHHRPDSPRVKLMAINGIHPPEQLFFGAADALLRGESAEADDFLRQARGRLPGPLFDTLLKDSFFQDFPPSASFYDPPSSAD
jgi:tetratricopeptide (TPR) repeat protein